MNSPYLRGISQSDREKLIKTLLDSQAGKCLICEEPMDPILHGNAIDIDHVLALSTGGKDDPSNFAATHLSCNRSKQASDLEVARIQRRFMKLKESLESENRSPNLGDVLLAKNGGDKELSFKIDGDKISVTFEDLGNPSIQTFQLLTDDLSGFRYFFAKLPIAYLRHDDRINPRSIGANISRLIEEFHQGRPQLHIPLAWMTGDGQTSAINIFDGQHKAAAQIMLVFYA